MPSLWASSGDRHRLAAAESALFLVGGYDGSGNYGDVLQLATAIETVGRLPGSPLPVAIVESETRGHHTELMRRYAEHFAAAAFAFFLDDAGEHDDCLDELCRLDTAPQSGLVYVYGGGHLNRRWGARKAAHVAAAEDLAAGRSLPVVASGLQVDETAVAPAGSAHELLARASWVGVRDIDSLNLIRKRIPTATGRVELAGDDALPFLTRQQGGSDAVVNLHLNDGGWIGDDPEAVREGIVALIRSVATAIDEPLELQPLIAYEDPRVSEREILSKLLERHGRELEGLGVTPVEPLDVLDDAFENRLASFGRARLTVACSYHVTLTSLLAGIPAVLLAQNEYYGQKAAGLRDLFELGSDRIGVTGTPQDGPAAIEAFVDGPARTELVSHLQRQSRRIAARFERSRAALSAALADGLRLSALESELGAARQRAEAAERELGAVRATRGWRALNRLRSARDMIRSNGGGATPPAPPAEAPTTVHDELGRLRALVEEATGRSDYALEVAHDMSLPTKMLAFMSWLDLLPPAIGPLLSVVLATRDRPQLLARAIPSVLAQRYQGWQLIVVDDGESPGTREVADAIDDGRVTVIEGPRRGLGAARNAGLDHASGEIVCYLDDDNVMHPGWLQAVAHVFSRREDIDVAYGISIAEHRIPDDLGEHGWWPSFWQLPWSRETLLEENVTDAGSLAHRRTLDEARFDEDLSTGEDWEMLLRLTVERDAFAIPALSHAYSMGAVDRMSRDPGHRAGLEMIRNRYEGA